MVFATLTVSTLFGLWYFFVVCGSDLKVTRSVMVCGMLKPKKRPKIWSVVISNWSAVVCGIQADRSAHLYFQHLLCCCFDVVVILLFIKNCWKMSGLTNWWIKLPVLVRSAAVQRGILQKYDNCYICEYGDM